MGKLKRCRGFHILFVIAGCCILLLHCLSMKAVAADGISMEQIQVNMPEIKIVLDGAEGLKIDEIEVYRNQRLLSNQSLSSLEEQDTIQRYYILMDVSKSINTKEFEAARSAVEAFCISRNEGEEVVLLTFGDSVEFILEGGETAEQISEKIAAIKRDSMNTQLYEAIKKVADIQTKDSGFVKKTVIVITDGIDAAALGSVTMQETADVLIAEGLPVYGLAVEYGHKEDVNLFGEFTRSTGGAVKIWNAENVGEGLESIRDEIQKMYVLTVSDSSNLVSYENETLTVAMPERDVTLSRKVLVDAWIADEIFPEIVVVTQTGENKISVTFSEMLEGMDTASNYRLEKDGELFVPLSVELTGDCEVEIAFQKEFMRGTYQLSCINMTDVSMEKNPLSGSAEISLEGYEPETESETAVGIESVLEVKEEENPVLKWIRDWGWIVIVAVLVLMAASICLVYRRLKEKKHLVVIGKDTVYADEVSVKKHVVVEKRPQVLLKLYPKNHQGSRQIIEHRFSNSVIIGRSDICEIYFDDPLMSRQHFVLEYENGKMMITDLETVNGTYVNGVKITKPRVLNQDDVIAAGTVELMIRWQKEE